MPPLGFPQTLLLLEKGRDWVYIIVGSAFVDKYHSLCECREGAVATHLQVMDLANGCSLDNSIT